jgi:hypothetical protein
MCARPLRRSFHFEICAPIPKDGSFDPTYMINPGWIDSQLGRDCATQAAAFRGRGSAGLALVPTIRSIIVRTLLLLLLLLINKEQGDVTISDRYPVCSGPIREKTGGAGNPCISQVIRVSRSVVGEAAPFGAVPCPAGHLAFSGQFLAVDARCTSKSPHLAASSRRPQTSRFGGQARIHRAWHPVPFRI